MTAGKLVRDRIPEIIRASGEEPITRPAEPGEFMALLLGKLEEETRELRDAILAGTVEGTRGELADVLEVVYTIMRDLGLHPANVEAARLAKKRERGGFDNRIVWLGNKPGEGA